MWYFRPCRVAWGFVGQWCELQFILASNSWETNSSRNYSATAALCFRPLISLSGSQASLILNCLLAVLWYGIIGVYPWLWRIWWIRMPFYRPYFSFQAIVLYRTSIIDVVYNDFSLLRHCSCKKIKVIIVTIHNSNGNTFKII